MSLLIRGKDFTRNPLRVKSFDGRGDLGVTGLVAHIINRIAIEKCKKRKGINIHKHTKNG